MSLYFTFHFTFLLIQNFKKKTESIIKNPSFNLDFFLYKYQEFSFDAIVSYIKMTFISHYRNLDHIKKVVQFFLNAINERDFP